jgi:hypothetical protein
MKMLHTPPWLMHSCHWYHLVTKLQNYCVFVMTTVHASGHFTTMGWPWSAAILLILNHHVSFSLVAQFSVFWVSTGVQYSVHLLALKNDIPSQVLHLMITFENATLRTIYWTHSSTTSFLHLQLFLLKRIWNVCMIIPFRASLWIVQFQGCNIINFSPITTVWNASSGTPVSVLILDATTPSHWDHISWVNVTFANFPLC